MSKCVSSQIKSILFAMVDRVPLYWKDIVDLYGGSWHHWIWKYTLDQYELIFCFTQTIADIFWRKQWLCRDTELCGLLTLFGDFLNIWHAASLLSRKVIEYSLDHVQDFGLKLGSLDFVLIPLQDSIHSVICMKPAV